jgi:hypothetical protein
LSGRFAFLGGFNCAIKWSFLDYYTLQFVIVVIALILSGIGSVILLKNKPSLADKFGARFAVAMNIFCPIISVYNFRVLSCIKVEHVQYLISDVDVTCWDNEHRPYVVMAVLLICVVTVGWPLSIGTFLYRNKERLADHEFFKRYKFLYGRYKPQFYYWGVVETVRRILMVACPDLFRTSPNFQMVFVLFVAFVFQCLHLALNPFSYTLYNMLTHCSLAAIWVMILSGISLKLSDGNEIFWVVFPMLLNLLAITLICYVALATVCKCKRSLFGMDWKEIDEQGGYNASVKARTTSESQEARQ